eukprot:10324531-Prorocentrum_lima.AAC.1
MPLVVNIALRTTSSSSRTFVHVSNFSIFNAKWSLSGPFGNVFTTTPTLTFSETSVPVNLEAPTGAISG